jgi:hypothetical protein
VLQLETKLRASQKEVDRLKKENEVLRKEVGGL